VDWIAAATAVAIGVGDGVVGRVPTIDKYSNVHTVYRLGILAGGLVGELNNWKSEITEPMILVSLGLLASRLPAAVSGGGWQQFGQVVAGDGVAAAAGLLSPAAAPLRIR
jgi:hypothetical protein